MGKKLTREEVLKKFEDTHKNRYNYDLVNYKGMHLKVNIICKKHGNFEQIPRDHIRGSGCIQCGYNKIRLGINKFITKSNIIFDNFYDYSLITSYKNNNEYVNIICPIHGEFEQTPHSHLKGYGCYKCGILKSSLHNKSLIDFDQECILYFINIYNDFENFYKIGYTFKKIEKRFGGKEKMPYDYKMIAKKNLKLKSAVQEEQSFLSNFKKYKYIPSQKFNGYTECFQPEIYNIMFNNRG